MPKNVKILDNNTEKILQDVSKIQTQLANGNKCYWVPEDEIPLGTLTVTQDGVYKASEDPNGPYYGYSQVTASGVGSISMGSLKELTITENGTYEAANETGGTYIGYSKVTVNISTDGEWKPSSGTVGKDDDGDDAIAVVNPSTGEIEVHKLSELSINEIVVESSPTKTSYVDDEEIDYSGLSVIANDSNSDPILEVPIGELILTVKKADISEANNGTQTIPVKWSFNGSTYETSFSITVTSS